MQGKCLLLLDSLQLLVVTFSAHPIQGILIGSEGYLTMYF